MSGNNNIVIIFMPTPTVIHLVYEWQTNHLKATGERRGDTAAWQSSEEDAE